MTQATLKCTRAYVEITNICNMHCSFCHGHSRAPRRMSVEEFSHVLDELEGNTGKYYKKLYIVGGGAKNQFLNRLTEEATGKQVIALPIEATALGNLKIQMEVK